WNKGSAITISRFDGYFGDKAKLDQVVYKPAPEKGARLAALQAGDVQMAMDIDPDDVASLKGKGFQIASGPYGESWALTFLPAPGSPLNDIRVRQAINYAIDRDSLVKQIFGGLTPRLDAFCGPDAFGSNPNIKGFPYDPVKAKSLLQEAGFGGGLSLGFES